MERCPGVGIALLEEQLLLWSHLHGEMLKCVILAEVGGNYIAGCTFTYIDRLLLGISPQCGDIYNSN